MTRIIYVEPLRAERIALSTRAILSRIPGLSVIAVVVYLFIQDPIWPYHLVTHPFVQSFMNILSDPIYRNWWMQHWMGIFIVIVSLMVILTVAFKMAVWNKAFKILIVRTRDEQDKIETEIGRAYWVERWSGQGAIRFGKALIKGLHIAEIKIGQDPKKKYRTSRPEPKLDLAISRADGKTDWVYKQTTSANGEKMLSPPGKRTIFYKATFWPPINIISPYRSMHRLVIDLPNDAINTYDGTMIMVEGKNLERDLTEDRPTFTLTNDSNTFVDLDLHHYKTMMNEDIKKATFTTNLASQMDTFLLKDQRKFQEISVPVSDLDRLAGRQAHERSSLPSDTA